MKCPWRATHDWQRSLFTDIEGSSRLWERYPGQMPEGLRLYEEFLGREIHGHAVGALLEALADSCHFVVFDSPPSAVAACAALAVQRALASDPWPGEEPFRVRMAIHTGPALARGNDLFGPTLNQTSGSWVSPTGVDKCCSPSRRPSSPENTSTTVSHSECRASTASVTSAWPNVFISWWHRASMTARARCDQWTTFPPTFRSNSPVLSDETRTSLT